MEVRYFLTGKELWRLGTFHWRRSRPLRQIIPVFILLVIALVMIVFGLLALKVFISPPSEVFSRLLLIIIGFLVLCFLAMVLIPTAFALTRRLAADRVAVLQGEHIVTISLEGFRHRTNQEDSLISWHTFKEITADQYGLYFCTSISTSATRKIVSRNYLIVHGIPRHVFAAPQEAETFLGQAQTYWANSQITPPAGSYTL